MRWLINWGMTQFFKIINRHWRKIAVAFLLTFANTALQVRVEAQVTGAETGSPSIESTELPESRIYIAPDDHTDYFWTADDVTYRAAFLEMIDYYLDQADRTQDAPPEFQSRWNCDGSLWLWEYEKNKPAPEFNRLIERVRSGHISAPMTALANTYGAQPAEAVLRGMYYAGTLERKYDLKFPMAVSMENQTLPLGLGALWAGSGAKYSWRGICACATKMEYKNFQQRDHEIYWWQGIDGSRVLMKWYSLGNNNASIGGYAEARKPREAIDWVRNNEGFKKRHKFGTIGLFGQGWDDLKTLSDEFPNVAREKSTANQKVIVSNEEDFFRDFEKHYGPRLPNESLAYGNEWDLYCMSMAEQTARVRRAVEKLRTAEALAAIVSMDDPKFWNERQAAREQANMNLGLYWEHDWTADASEEMRTKRGNWQRKLADEISAYVDELQDSALEKLAKNVSSEKGRHRFVIFNPLGWERDGLVDLPLALLPTLDPGGRWKAIDVRDQFELAISQSTESVLAKVPRVPPVGYRVIEFLPVAGGIQEDTTVVDFELENESILVKVSNLGTITSLVDKKSGRELAGPAGLNVLRGKNLLPAGNLATSVEQTSNPLQASISIKINSGLPRSTTISLPAEADWIEIENTIRGNFSDVYQWEFDFAVDDPDVHHEEVGAILRARLATGDATGGHYATKNARYDWLSLGHFLNVQNLSTDGKADLGATLANYDCAFFRLGESTPAHLDSDSAKISVLAGGQVDGPKLGIRDQGGDTKFTQRFSIKVNEAKFDPVESMRWSVERQNPLAVAPIPNSKTIKKTLSGSTYSLLNCGEESSVLLWAVKPSEEGIENGIIARAWNVSNESTNVALSMKGLESAVHSSHIETDGEALSVSGERVELNFRPQQIKTVRLNQQQK